MNLTLVGLCERERRRDQLLPSSEELEDDDDDVTLGGSSPILSDKPELLVAEEVDSYLGGWHLLVDVGIAGAEIEVA